MSTDNNNTSRRQELFDSGVQFGHQVQFWNPRMKPFIWGEKNGIHLINIAITEIQIQKAEKLLEEIAEKGLSILWVGTKRVAREIVTSLAVKTGSPFFSERWIGGTLTNYHEVKKSVTKMLHNQDILNKTDEKIHTKKELALLKKKVDMSIKKIGGIQKLSWPVGALVVADAYRDAVAIREALAMNIPVIALVDSNCSPNGISVVIPANDDLGSSISTIFGYLADAVTKGKEKFLAANPEKKHENKASDERKNNFQDNKKNSFQKNNNNRKPFNKTNQVAKKQAPHEDNMTSQVENQEKIAINKEVKEVLENSNSKPGFIRRTNKPATSTNNTTAEKPAPKKAASSAVKSEVVKSEKENKEIAKTEKPSKKPAPKASKEVK
jgi:small subunit ribosomal protein S2